MGETGIDSRSDLPNRAIRWRLVNVVDSEVVDLWMDRLLCLLIGVNLGMAINAKPSSEMAIMLERLEHKAAINYLEARTNERQQLTAIRTQHAGNDQANQANFAQSK